jgi:hypothetical protein
MEGHRADDLPPYIVIFLVGHIIGYLVLEIEMGYDVPLWISILSPVPVPVPPRAGGNLPKPCMPNVYCRPITAPLTGCNSTRFRQVAPRARWDRHGHGGETRR